MNKKIATVSVCVYKLFFYSCLKPELLKAFDTGGHTLVAKRASGKCKEFHLHGFHSLAYGVCLENKGMSPIIGKHAPPYLK